LRAASASRNRFACEPPSGVRRIKDPISVRVDRLVCLVTDGADDVSIVSVDGLSDL
jgi:hypothetical protein